MEARKTRCEFCNDYTYRPCETYDEAEWCSEGNETDPINPTHYARYTIEPIDFIRQNNLDYVTGNVIKYVLRHDHKNGLEDLEKAQRYLDWLKDRYRDQYE